MEKQQIIATWVTEKFGMNQQEIVNFLLEHATDSIAAVPEFQEWLTEQKAKLAAQKTPEALEAQRLETEKALKAQAKVVDELLG